MNNVEQAREALRRLADGCSNREVARQLGVSDQAVSQWKRLGLPRRVVRTTGRRKGDPRPEVDSAIWRDLPEGRPRKVAMVTAMRAAGWLYREIIEETGISKGMIEGLIHDPNRTLMRERLRAYERPCIDCGKTINPQGIRNAHERCQTCAVVHRRSLTVENRRGKANENTYSDEQILACLRAAALDDVLTGVRYDAWRERRGRVGIPSRPLVVRRFDTWRRAVMLAGLTPGPRVRSYERTGEAQCLAAVGKLADTLGRFPTVAEYDDHARRVGAPSGVLVRIRVGSWAQIERELEALAA